MVLTSRTMSVEDGVNDQLLSHYETLHNETRLQDMEPIMKY